MPDVRRVWDEPELGLTTADFARWPAKSRFERTDGHATCLAAAFDEGALTFPVYLAGECTTYDTHHGHPSFAGARHDGTFFVVSGEPGTPWPMITCMRSRGLLTRRVEITAFTYDHIDLAIVELFASIGYVDIQLSRLGSPAGRIGFPYFKEPSTLAHRQAQAVGDAILKCRSGSLPNK